MTSVSCVEANVELERCSLASCLELCLHDVEERSTRSADLLKLAIRHLRRTRPRILPPASLHASRPVAVVPYLSYLLPELDRASPDAALAVREAVAQLRDTRRAEVRVPVLLH